PVALGGADTEAVHGDLDLAVGAAHRDGLVSTGERLGDGQVLHIGVVFAADRAAGVVAVGQVRVRAIAQRERRRPEIVVIEGDLVVAGPPQAHIHGAVDAIAFQVDAGDAAALLLDGQCGELAVGDEGGELATGNVVDGQRSRVLNLGHGEVD